MGVFEVRVVQGAPGPRGLETWDNVWHVASSAVSPATVLDSVAPAFATFHRNWLGEEFTVERVVLSTFEPDSHPYDPTVLGVFPVGLPGLQDHPEGRMPWTSTLYVNKITAFGRPGHFHLHGLLKLIDVQVVNGFASLIDPDTFATNLETSFAALQAAMPIDTQISVVSKVGGVANSRPVAALGGLRISTHQGRRKHAAFVSPSDPLAQIARIVEQAGVAAEAINPIIELFNALPLQDVPLLPG